MKKRTIIFCTAFILCLVAGIFISNKYFQNSSKQIAKKVSSLTENNKIISYEDTYTVLNDFFYNKNHSEIIAKYYNTIFNNDTVEDTYSNLYAQYTSSMLYLGKYNEFMRFLNEEITASDDNLKDNYFLHLWFFSVIYSDENNLLDFKTISQTLLDTKIEDENLEKSKMTFLYFGSKYFDIEMSENISKFKDLDSYETFRTQYVLPILITGKYNDFEKMLLSEYINDPFTGTDIMILIHSEDFVGNEQLDKLYKALEKLKEEYRTKRSRIFPLKKLIIENLQDQITSVQSVKD